MFFMCLKMDGFILVLNIWFSWVSSFLLLLCVVVSLVMFCGMY